MYIELYIYNIQQNIRIKTQDAKVDDITWASDPNDFRIAWNGIGQLCPAEVFCLLLTLWDLCFRPCPCVFSTATYDKLKCGGQNCH